MQNQLFKLVKLVFLFFLVSLFLIPQNSEAQRKKKKKDEVTEVSSKDSKEKKEKTIDELIKKSNKTEGLFTIYQDTVSGGLQMLISEDQLNKEYIHFSQIGNGVEDVDLFRGQFSDSKVFKITKYFDKIEFTTQNTSFYFAPDNAISKSKDANISEGIMASIKIEASDKKTGMYLIKVDDLFLKETLAQIKPAKSPGQKPENLTLGKLDDSKSKINSINNYPENTNVAVEYVYSNTSVRSDGSDSVSDKRNISIKVFHSLIAIPENDYEIRIDDPRVGYFLTNVNDQTSLSSTPYRDLIHRWNLKKKDPGATISEPIEPIIWWMENTTPKELRPIIKRAGEQWNIAFVKAGFKNAIVIKEQPDDADWDAGDIRYNVLRWTSSPKPPWGGYGPSFVNPRTGEILGADIMLEYSTLGYLLRNEKLFDGSSLTGIYDEMTNQITSYEQNTYCSASKIAQLNQMFGSIANSIFEAGSVEKSKMVNEFLYFLILHEMGHTLGLNHNMKSSQFHSIAEINDEALTSQVGLTGSVMDYPSINYSSDRNNQGQYWTTRPGPYDIWAIQFGYQSLNKNERETLLSKSTQPELTFGNDADDMRSPGKAIDPRVNVNDMTSDAIQYSIDRIKLTQIVGKEVLKKYQEQDKGSSFQTLLNSYLILTGQQASSTNIISRYIGGVYVDRSMNGQPGATKPYTPVEKEVQKKAMNAISQYAFAPNAFTVPNNLYNYLARQRRGFDFYKAPEDPKIHKKVLGMQKNILEHLLHPNTLQRIVDSELYGNKYTLSEMMTDLNNAIFKADIHASINSFRQNLQLEYTNMLIDILTEKQKDKYLSTAKSMALYNLKNIRTWSSTSGNISSKAHKQHLRIYIDNAIKEIK